METRFSRRGRPHSRLFLAAPLSSPLPTAPPAPTTHKKKTTFCGWGDLNTRSVELQSNALPTWPQPRRGEEALTQTTEERQVW